MALVSRRSDGIENVSMFDELPDTPGIEKQKPPKTAGSAWCPGCRISAKRAIGVLVVGDHVVYREHTKPTWSGAQVTCPNSGVALHVSPPVDKHDGKILRCSCQGSLKSRTP